MIVICCGLAAWPQLSYNGDLRVLDAPDATVRADEEYFSKVWGNKQEQAFVISTGHTLSEALDAADRLYHFLVDHSFDGVHTISPFFPGQQTQKRNRANWATFWSAHRGQFESDFYEAALAAGFDPVAFSPFFAGSMMRRRSWSRRFFLIPAWTNSRDHDPFRQRARERCR